MNNKKSKFETLSIKVMLVYGLAVVCQISAIVVIFLSVYIEPKGELHNSVLTYFGISCGFCGSILGISTHYSNELTKFKSNVMDSMHNV